ncbi:hypothetical protein SynBIOSE41_01695 [Synechococcus sp. BIOS-E4-1]|nr:hypothetical protein SynBIOSE41_01695 [Synechococcus sp. BIOS-E4-1]
MVSSCKSSLGLIHNSLLFPARRCVFISSHLIHSLSLIATVVLMQLRTDVQV